MCFLFINRESTLCGHGTTECLEIQQRLIFFHNKRNCIYVTEHFEGRILSLVQFTLLLQNRILKRKRRIFIVVFYVTTPWFQHIFESSLPDIVRVDFLNNFVQSERVDFLLGIVGEIPIFGPELQNTEHKTRRLHSWKIWKIYWVFFWFHPVPFTQFRNPGVHPAPRGAP